MLGKVGFARDAIKHYLAHNDFKARVLLPKNPIKAKEKPKDRLRKDKGSILPEVDPPCLYCYNLRADDQFRV